MISPFIYVDEQNRDEEVNEHVFDEVDSSNGKWTR